MKTPPDLGTLCPSLPTDCVQGECLDPASSFICNLPAPASPVPPAPKGTAPGLGV